jgi:hypothetical protein
MSTQLSRLQRLLRPTSRTARQSRSFRPRCERLEDRSVPSVMLSRSMFPLGMDTSVTVTASEPDGGDTNDPQDLPYTYRIDWMDGSKISTGTYSVSGSQLKATLSHQFLKPVTQITVITLENPDPYPDTSTDTAKVTITFPTAGQIMGAGNVASAMLAAWNDTLNFAKAHSMTNHVRREEGFAIQFNSETDAYVIGTTQFGPAIGPHGTGELTLSEPADNPGAHLFTVADFHTHTPVAYLVGPAPDQFHQGVRRKTGPSQADNDDATALMIPGLVYDYTATYIYSRDPVNSPAGPSVTMSVMQRPSSLLQFNGR